MSLLTYKKYREITEQKSSNHFFKSDLDRKNYMDLTVKSHIREDYLKDILETQILQLGPKRKSKSCEKIPIEAGYSLNFNRGLLMKRGIPEHTKDIRSMLYSNQEWYDCFRLSKYYSDIIVKKFKDVLSDPNETVYIFSPPKGGIAYEKSIEMNIALRHGEFFDYRIPAISFPRNDDKIFNCEKNIKKIDDSPKINFNPRIRKKQKGNSTQRFSNGKIIICDDCLITGNAIRRETSKIMQSQFFGEIIGIVVGVDCGMYGWKNKRVSEELAEEYMAPVESIIDIEEAIHHFKNNLMEDIYYPIKKDCYKHMKKTITGLKFIINEENVRKRFNEEVYKPFHKYMKTQRENPLKFVEDIPKLMKE